MKASFGQVSAKCSHARAYCTNYSTPPLLHFPLENFASYIYARLSKKRRKNSSYLPLVRVQVVQQANRRNTGLCTGQGPFSDNWTPRVLNEAIAFSFFPFPLDNLVLLSNGTAVPAATHR